MLTGLFTQFLIEIIAAVILIPVIIKYSGMLIKYLKTKRFEQRMKKVYGIYQEISKLQHSIGSDRVLLLRTTNGGGLPHPGKVLYASIIAEVNSPEQDSYSAMRDEWQNRLIDHDYISMLFKVYTEGFVMNVVSEMPEHSMLRGAYEKIGITHTAVINVGVYNGAFYYISVACKSEKKLTPAREYTVNTSVAAIRKLLN